MVPWKSWVSENFGLISESRQRFLPSLGISFSSRSVGSRNLGFLRGGLEFFLARSRRITLLIIIFYDREDPNNRPSVDRLIMCTHLI